MIIYFCLMFGFVILCERIYKLNQERVLLLLGIIILWGLASFRSYDIGRDTSTYNKLYSDICNGAHLSSWNGRYEIGYLIINKLISILSDNFTVFLCIVNLFIYGIYFKFIDKYSSNKMMSLFLFLTLGFWGATVNVIRLQIAICICLLALMKKEEGHKILPIILMVSALLFQRISIAFILSYFVPKKLNRNIYILGSLCTVCLYGIVPLIINMVSSLFPYYAHYLNDSVYSAGGIRVASVIRAIIQLCILILGIVTYLSMEIQDDKTKEKICYESNLVAVSFVIMFFSFRFNLLDRCANFYWTFSITLIPDIIQYWSKRKNASVTRLAIYILSVLYFYITNYYRNEWNMICPYKFIWKIN